MKGIDFNHMPCIYWSNITKASYLQRQILVHSILYYRMSENIILDSQFDTIGKQLVQLREQMDEQEYSKTQYYYCFEDFDASTGFYLYDRLIEKDQRYLTQIATHVLRLYKQGRR